VSPKVAVLMCCHNSQSYIRESIESILDQTYSDFEFIIVENGSTDRTWEIINSYDDPRIKTFKTDLVQLVFNLNYGLLQTRAEFIARMDSDDISSPRRLERQIAYLDAHPEVAVLGTAFKLFGDGITDRVVSVPVSDKHIRRRLPFVFSICHPTVVFRKTVILKHGGYLGGTHCEDLDLWLRVSRDKAVKFANLDESLLEYRISPSQVKGSVEGYAGVAGILCKEAIVQKSPRLFFAFVCACLKVFRGRRKL